MAPETPRSIRFCGFELDLEKRELYRAGNAVAIQQKPLDLLIHLIRQRGRLVSKEELLREAWPDVAVSEHALNSALRDLRRALGESEAARSSIVTVRGRGYRFRGLDSQDDLGPESAPGARSASEAPRSSIRLRSVRSVCTLPVLRASAAADGDDERSR